MTNLFGQPLWARRGEAAPAASSIGMSELPVGVPVPWPSATAPTGWLLCDGSAVPVGCPTLSSLYGANLPDLRGVFILGRAAAGTGSTLLGTGGSANAVVVSHNHTQDSHNHTQNSHGHGVTDPAHRHGFQGDTGARWIGTAVTPNGLASVGVAQSCTVAAMDTATTGVTVNGDTATNIGQTATNQADGVSGTDARLPPFKAFNYIVRAA